MKTAWRKYRGAWGWIALFSLLVTAAVGIYAHFYQSGLYESKVGLYILPGGVGTGEAYDPAVSEMIARDCEALLQNPVILQRTEAKLTPLLLEGMKLAVEGEKGTHVVWLKVSGADPVLCQTAAMALGAVFVDHLSAATPHQVSVATGANEPQEPVGPNRALILLTAFAACFAAFSLAFFLFAPKAETLGLEDARAGNLGLAVLGAIPDYRRDLSRFFRKKGEEGRILSQWVDPACLEEVKALSLALAGGGDQPWHSVALASVGADEGKSGLAVLLAAALCSQGKRVLLVDMDCYCPTLGRLLGVQGRRDLLDHLAGKAGLQEVLTPTALRNLFFIDNLHPDSCPWQVVHSQAFEAFLDRMGQEFDHVLVDTPPLGLFADAGALGSVLEGTLLVAADHRLTPMQFQEARERLSQAHNRLLGLVFTFVPRKGLGRKRPKPAQRPGAKAAARA
ncbi:MAG: CpsD/CapB family tyrosine-protein kinase [Candidatus Limiplasma sp.]|nr:CpsD/CapB family tyrosine-protein kinase [Candidatus Limiplasma sp.]